MILLTLWCATLKQHRLGREVRGGGYIHSLTLERGQFVTTGSDGNINEYGTLFVFLIKGEKLPDCGNCITQPNVLSLINYERIGDIKKSLGLREILFPISIIVILIGI